MVTDSDKLKKANSNSNSNSNKKKGYSRDNNNQQNPSNFRVRLPKGDREFIGLVEQRLGGSRMRVKCFDGKVRICRIPGKLKRRLWIRENDIVIVEAWEIQGDEKGDVIYKYRRNQVDALKRRGYLKEIEDYEEF